MLVLSTLLLTGCEGRMFPNNNKCPPPFLFIFLSCCNCKIITLTCVKITVIMFVIVKVKVKEVMFTQGYQQEVGDMMVVAVHMMTHCSR